MSRSTRLLAAVAVIALSVSAVWTQLRTPDVAPPRKPGGLKLVTFADGFNSPLLVTHAADGSDRLFVVEQDGRIMVVRGGKVERRPFLDITERTEGEGEQGLLGLAFHPRYERTRRFFINYTDNAGDTVIEEYNTSATDPDRADPTSGRVLLTIDQPFANHNGGGLVFGRDGYLYIATGDGGAAGDPQANGQRLNTLLGKILRIDVDRRADGAGYAIPEDNPFVGSPVTRPEIWDYGLRNPWRISFDRATDDLWIADVGQFDWEEVNREPANDPGGNNYGWNLMEGDRCFPSGIECNLPGLELPVSVYSHADGSCSVTGGYVYRGTRYRSLRGRYVFADYCSGKIWAIDADGKFPQDPLELLDTEYAISSFGEDDRGELYLTDHTGGTVLQVQASR